jgi:Dyp-type peroxidase family
MLKNLLKPDSFRLVYILTEKSNDVSSCCIINTIKANNAMTDINNNNSGELNSTHSLGYTVAQDSTTPKEPVLDVDDIQGNIIPGFNKPHQFVLCYQITNVATCKQFLKEIKIGSLKDVLENRKVFRALKKKLGRKPTIADSEALRACWTNIAFSYQGVSKLTADNAFNSEAFKVGLAARSPLLGDPTNTNNEGYPGNWIVGSNDKVPDIFIIIGTEAQADLDEKVGELKSLADKYLLTCIYEEEMNTIDSDGVTGREQFGFKDGISQPGVRGVLSDNPTEYLQQRAIAPEVLPDSLLYGYPGQFLSWTGEFLFGHPAQTLDPLIPGLKRTEGPAWTTNGSYLVFRRYKQDVKMFWKFMLEESKKLAEKKGFEGMTQEKLAAMLMGRWPGGAPFARVQDADNKELGRDQMANNYFRYASDSCPVKLVNGRMDNYPQAKADPIGLTCPMTAHIRKVNTRDTSNDAGGTMASFNQRLLRRGLPYGPPLANPMDPNEPDPANGDRGLLFMSYQTSIEDQFEFLNNRWMSNKFTPRSPGGDDILIGQNDNAGEKGTRDGILFGKDVEIETVSTHDQWITPTGGEYFFSPSISAIKTILAI